ncbi:outer membrane protein [Novosphingobium sp. PhB165]|uniref:TolC family outer membrane protein n=1 Tax=Novosphingobium sp. PhB165 TaxID=2485105 RepID=UPI00105017A0|nr:TolC family outer membrane protein [Novosphingobium sp. PhB165]TCM18560.1 outer membrane protein [Novosphingobium sp. PhB165]
MARFALRTGLLAGGCLTLATASAPALADTLREALVLAYQTNPTLEAARAQQRATDEGVPIARSSGLPSLSADSSFTKYVDAGAAKDIQPTKILSAGVDLGVPIYSGGSVRNSVAAAKIRVEAGQASLRGSESSLFSQVVGAYMDVIRAEAIVGLNQKNVAVLKVNLQATSDRFQIGELTRTDVAQSQSRLAVANGDLRSAEANLAAARETYIRLIGKAPEALETPPPLPNLPATPEEATSVALDANPDVIAARQRSKAAEKDIDVAGAGRLPRVSLFSQGGYTDYLGSADPRITGYEHNHTVTAGAQVSIPLFQGGLPAAQRRQAQATASATLEQEIATERGVIAQVRSAYTAWLASNDLIVSSKTAVDAASLSLEGVRAENSVGNRTILDILNAEQELLNAQVDLVTAQRNAYVAGFTLLAAMGRAEARDLNLDGGVLYDPQVNYDRVKGKIFDWDNDPAPVAKSTRTVDTPVQDGEIHEQ